jgi:uncharacterized membrane protein YsdA (DUF1294 family)/cold shock CspA family protein
MQEIAGRIDHWDDQKGYGFILAEDGRKVFFHISSMRGAKRPQVGENVHFRLEQSEQGRLSASHVRHTHLALDNEKIRLKPRISESKKDSSSSLKPPRPDKKLRLHEHKFPRFRLLLLLILPLIGALSLFKDYGTLWILAAYIGASFITYYFYWDDKRRAKMGEWRTPEANLHFWSLVGGWPGALIAQQQFRHKTKKLSFQLIFWLIVIAHQLLWFDWLIPGGKWLVSMLG